MSQAKTKKKVKKLVPPPVGTDPRDSWAMRDPSNETYVAWYRHVGGGSGQPACVACVTSGGWDDETSCKEGLRLREIWRTSNDAPLAPLRAEKCDTSWCYQERVQGSRFCQKHKASDDAYNAPEPPPVANQGPAVWSLVIRDMADRDVAGAKKYGVRLQPGNKRDALVDAYQESLDLAVYLRQAIYERDGR